MENREIKFRYWDTKKKLMNYCDTTYFDYLSKFFIEYDYEHPEINEVHLMQFTGLHDKNGKEIYEGDILQNAINDRLFNWRIDFHNGGFKLRNIGIDGYLDEHRPLYNSIATERIVIGNIYQPPQPPAK